jgi:hypothetical protein
VTRADRVERMLRAFEEAGEARLSKLRGAAREAIVARSREERADRARIFLVALATVSDGDLAPIERELGLAPPLPPARRRDHPRV